MPVWFLAAVGCMRYVQYNSPESEKWRKGAGTITKQLSVLVPHYRECSLKLWHDVEWMRVFLMENCRERTIVGKPEGQFCVRIATLSSYHSVTDLKWLVILQDGDQFQESSLGSCCGSRDVLVMWLRRVGCFVTTRPDQTTPGQSTFTIATFLFVSSPKKRHSELKLPVLVTNYHYSRGVLIPVARSAWRMSFLRWRLSLVRWPLSIVGWRLIFLGFECGTCFISPFLGDF